jgi:hypothetical protein
MMILAVIFNPDQNTAEPYISISTRQKDEILLRLAAREAALPGGENALSPRA